MHPPSHPPSSLPADFFLDRSIDLGTPEVLRLSDLAWPNYLRLESDIPEPGHQFKMSKSEFVRRFPIWGIRSRTSNTLVAFAHAVLLEMDLSVTQLPDDGWRFAIRHVAESHRPNCLCLVVASIDPVARGHGLSRHLIEYGKTLTQSLGFKEMIAPVRPTQKHLYPFESMSEYLSRTGLRGKIFDPWLRIHSEAGAEFANICRSSVNVAATLSKWREWTGLALTASGAQQIPGGLVPLSVDVQRNIGVYSEPNVWVRYRL